MVLLLLLMMMMIVVDIVIVYNDDTNKEAFITVTYDNDGAVAVDNGDELVICLFI